VKGIQIEVQDALIVDHGYNIGTYLLEKESQSQAIVLPSGAMGRRKKVSQLLLLVVMYE
jgi:hypothetical protein